MGRMRRRRSHSRRNIILASCSSGLLILFIGLWIIIGHMQTNADTWQQLMRSTAVLANLPHRNPDQPSAHLTNADQPLPTNRWFSSLAFDQTNPVFAYPLSYALTGTGFAISYAPPIASPNTVSTPHTNDVSVSFNTQTTAAVAAYDDLSVTVAHRTAGNTIATSRITEGSPFIFVSPANKQTVTVTTTGSIIDGQNNTLYFQVGNKTYGLTGTVAPVLSGNTVHLSGNFALYILPNGANKAIYSTAAQSPVTGTTVTYAQEGSRYITTYSLTTNSGKPTLWGTIPQQAITVSSNVAGTLPSLAGTETFEQGNTFIGSQPFQAPAASLAVANLSTADKATLVSQLKQDVSTTTFSATDSYGAGKELYRAANLLQLAEQLGQQEQADIIKAQLTAQLDMWLNPTGYKTQANKYFYYDTAFRGLVGVDASYGTDQFNDHNFHYGYIIYAAAVLSSYDHSFMHAHQDMINLIVRDIANPVQDTDFPRLRGFDEYFGHSWAAGTSDFADGNNQESSSEAVLAWNGIYQWATVSKDSNLQTMAGWLYTREVTGAEQQWLYPSNTSFAGYAHPFASLIWGGKFDYATWFSADPSAMLAIQLIPLSPGHAYVLNNASGIRADLATVNSNPTLFKDYIAMYDTRLNPEQSIQTIESLQPADFDSANSKTYALAWIYTQRDQ